MKQDNEYGRIGNCRNGIHNHNMFIITNNLPWNSPKVESRIWRRFRVVVENRAWTFENRVALRLRNWWLGPKGPRFNMLRIWEKLFHQFGTRAWIRMEVAWFLRRFRDYNDISLGIWTPQVFRLAEPHYLSKCFYLGASKFELYL